MTPAERDLIANAHERGLRAAGFDWRPYPAPAGTTYRITDRRFYLVRDSLGESRECEYFAWDENERGPVFVHGDGRHVEVEAVFCALEEKKNDV